jgi:hypothetical protein
MMKTANYYFRTSETGKNYAPRIYLEPRDDEAAKNPYMIFLELNEGTTLEESDALAAQLRKYVAEVSFSAEHK